MRLVRGSRLGKTRPGGAVVTMGNFDGVHRGHQKVIAEARRRADKRGVDLVVISFDPHPEQLISPETAPKLLTTVEEKQWIMERLGVDTLWIIPFTTKLAAVSAENFFRRFVIKEAGAVEVVLGHDHRFGAGARGDFAMVKHLTEGTSIKAEMIHPEQVPGANGTEAGTVSSTLIRKWVSRGDFDQANRLLGYPFLISGQVVHGRGLGREMGFPTINLDLIPANKLLPSPGIYYAQAVVQGCLREGAFYVGNQPTFGGNRIGIELHLLDFSGDLYGAHVLIYMRGKVREDRKFDSADSLAQQIKTDVARIRALAKENSRKNKEYNLIIMEDLCP